MTVGVLALLVTIAAAQDEGPPPSSPEPVVQSAPVPRWNRVPPATTLPSQLRLGGGATFGAMGPHPALIVGLEAHGGIQLIDQLGLLLSVHVLGGWDGNVLFGCQLCAPDPYDPTSAVVLLGALAELTLLDRRLTVALGPTLGHGYWAGAIIGRSRDARVDGLVAGADLRIGWNFGRRRARVFLGGDLLVLAAPGATFYLPSGDPRFPPTDYSRGTAWLMVPALMVAFELR